MKESRISYNEIKPIYHTRGEDVNLMGFGKLKDASPSTVIDHMQEFLKNGGSPSIIFMKVMLAYVGTLDSKVYSTSVYFDGEYSKESVVDVLKKISEYIREDDYDVVNHIIDLLNIRYSQTDLETHMSDIVECLGRLDCALYHGDIHIEDMAIRARGLGMNMREIFDFYFPAMIIYNPDIDEEARARLTKDINALNNAWTAKKEEFSMFID